MSIAFEIIEEDVSAALVKLDPKAKKFVDMYGLTPAKIFDRLNLDKVEKAALRGDELDEQTNLAHEEIRQQVFDWWVNASIPVKKKQ
jgi:hypothetical protein